MAGMDWFCWHHGSVNDPKFQLVAKRSKSSVAEVIAVWACLLEAASMADSRGNVKAMNVIDVAILLGMSSAAVWSVRDQLEARGFIAKGRVVSHRRYFPVDGGRPSSGIWAAIRDAIFKRDGYTCQYCGVHGVRLECDHIVSVADGGAHDPSNLATACFDCNRSKGAKSLADWEKSRGR